MSTRCQIGFYKDEKQKLNRPEVLLYCGNDGRPGCMMPLLIASLQTLDDDNRLDDIETSSAKVLYDMMHYLGKSHPKSYTAYGISKLFHGDIDYFYAIYTSGFVKAFSINNLGLLCETGKGVRTLKKVNIKEAPRETESHPWVLKPSARTSPCPDSHPMLAIQIETRLHERQGKVITNFPVALPPAESDMTAQRR